MKFKADKIVKTLGVLFFLFVLIFVFSLFATNWKIESEDVIFEIKKGEGVFEIADKLKEKGVLNYSSPFVGYLIVTGKVRDLKAGNYQVDKAINLFKTAEVLTNGEVLTKRLTIVEGWNSRDIANYLEENEFCGNQEFFSVTGLPDLRKESLEIESEAIEELKDEFFILSDIPENNLEGYLFPDTYVISSSDPESLVRRMLINLEDKISTDLLNDMNKNGREIHEVITMASLLEKEVIGLEDKKMVSDILWRRLKAGIPLQIDATINYITPEHLVDVKNRHTEIDSPYNTYQNLGLPKGPISNPSIESIKAAIEPMENDYWYYLSTPTGETIFSRTHRDHVQAKNLYLR